MPTPTFECDICSDTGRVFTIETGLNGREYNAVKDCVCRLERIRQKRLSAIPPKFQSVELEQLQPKTDIHPAQKEFVPFLKGNPDRNYFFGGKFGTGKTLFMWALYRHAVMTDRPRVVVCTLSELLNEYKAFIQACMDRSENKSYPRISAEALRQNHTRYSIFLDDIDKAKPTEYAAEQLFELANAIYDFQHQVVITTNLSLNRLITHFERADDRFGGAIVRRLVDGAKICEMF